MRRAVHIVILTVIFSAPWLQAAAQTLTRGPYLQRGAPDAVIIRWRTDIPTDSRVWYAEPPESVMVVDNPLVTTEHRVLVSGLTPDTRYFYAVGSTAGGIAGGDADHYFRTSPVPGTQRPTRVWVIGDSGLPGPGAAQVRDAYLAYPGSADTDVWLMLGDNAYNTGTDAEYQAAVFDMYPQLLRNTILWPTRGNHDLLHAGFDYYDIFSLPRTGQSGGLPSGTEAYYSFDFANIHFICLDSFETDRSADSTMMTWLTQDLAATSQEWILAFWHHPPYTKGSHDSDVDADSGGRMRDMRQNALPILEAGGADLVLCGHSHSYERSCLLDQHYGYSWELHDSMKVDPGDGDVGGDGAYLKPTLGPGTHEGTVYAVAGSSSRLGGGTLDHPVMVTSLNVLGSLALDVNGDELSATFIDNTGGIRDQFTVIKGVSPTGIQGRAPSASPRLWPAAPNPFGLEARIRYSIPEADRVSLAVYDVTGRKVASLVEGFRDAGDHTAVWSARSADGLDLPQGVYFGVLEYRGERRARKLVIVR